MEKSSSPCKPSVAAISTEELLFEHCRKTRQWAVFLSLPMRDAKFVGKYTEEAQRAAPYLSQEQIFEAALCRDGTLIVLCKSERVAYRLFDQTVGDDGPTETNPYNGDFRIYAMVVNRKGEAETENT